MEEAKKLKYYNRLIYKQFVSGLCGPQFLRFFLPKRFTHLRRASYGDAILVYRFGAPIWPPGNQQKHLEFTFSIKAFSFHLRTSIFAHKHILQFLKWLYCRKSRGMTFFQRDCIPILVSRNVKTRKFKLLYFRSETCYGNGNLYKDLLFVYFQLSLNKNW